MEEQFDVLDCRGVRTGDRIGRDEAHATGTWHGAFHCLIIYPGDDRMMALFQKRSREKRIAPGRFDVSVGGHYAAGEDASIAGPREVREEIGLSIRFDELVPLGIRTFVYCYTPGILEYEFQDVFLLPRASRPQNLVLQDGEVDSLLELDIDEGILLFSGEKPFVQGILHSRQDRAVQTDVERNAFVPCRDNYYLKLLALARRYLRGERDILAV